MSNYDYTIFCWINPIAPLQTSTDIIKTVKYFEKNNLDSLITSESKKVHSIFNRKPINYLIKNLISRNHSFQ